MALQALGWCCSTLRFRAIRRYGFFTGLSVLKRRLQRFSVVYQRMQHVETLGMAIEADHRGQGLGRALISKAVAHAYERRLSRIELTVHSENTVAQALYNSVRFLVEGTQMRGWRINNRYADVLSMARLSDA